MNKQIQELADQCRTEYRDGHGGFTEQFDEEKFAELIVQECIAVLNNRFMGDLNREDLEVRRCIADVKQHFGVEE
jgi:hypothetical protein